MNQHRLPLQRLLAFTFCCASAAALSSNAAERPHVTGYTLAPVAPSGEVHPVDDSVAWALPAADISLWVNGKRVDVEPRPLLSLPPENAYASSNATEILLWATISDGGVYRIAVPRAQLSKGATVRATVLKVAGPEVRPSNVVAQPGKPVWLFGDRTTAVASADGTSVRITNLPPVGQVFPAREGTRMWALRRAPSWEAVAADAATGDFRAVAPGFGSTG